MSEHRTGWRESAHAGAPPGKGAFLRLLERVRKVRELSRADRQVLLLSMIALPLMWAALRLLGLAKLHSWIGGQLARPSETFAFTAAARALDKMVNLAARICPFPSTCLSRSLVLQWILCRRGIPSQLRIGVRTEGRDMRAHAWVECDGLPVNDLPDVSERFPPLLAVMPAGGSASE